MDETRLLQAPRARKLIRAERNMLPLDAMSSSLGGMGRERGGGGHDNMVLKKNRRSS